MGAFADQFRLSRTLRKARLRWPCAIGLVSACVAAFRSLFLPAAFFFHGTGESGHPTALQSHLHFQRSEAARPMRHLRASRFRQHLRTRALKESDQHNSGSGMDNINGMQSYIDDLLKEVPLPTSLALTLGSMGASAAFLGKVNLAALLVLSTMVMGSIATSTLEKIMKGRRQLLDRPSGLQKEVGAAAHIEPQATIREATTATDKVVIAHQDVGHEPLEIAVLTDDDEEVDIIEEEDIESGSRRRRVRGAVKRFFKNLASPLMTPVPAVAENEMEKNGADKHIAAGRAIAAGHAAHKPDQELPLQTQPMPEPRMENGRKKEDAEAKEEPAAEGGSAEQKEPNLVLTVASRLHAQTPESKAPGVELLMAQPGGDILATMGGSDWKVNPVEPSKGIYEMFLPPVTYNLPIGSVTIPPPHFLVTVKDIEEVNGDEHERMTGELTLQNGHRILTVDCSFPLSTTFTLSSEGTANARIGRIGDSVYLQADVCIGLFLPKVPGLAKLMEMFIKAYANQSCDDCARALAQGADRLSSQAQSKQRSGVTVALTAAAVAASELDMAAMTAQGTRMLVEGAEVAAQSSEVLEAVGSLP